ncbi:hypothetical protein AJ85_01040 [Alkalihalobacillus alcalophilus ATCC 27647 = CGMCC 1.3604]|uniref:Uncharacterized protein n=1 Tax=Alkalihalobacillus alcalophilus ATCC 27647 = CGMCC 1.3604 TaxID=1218173 RepID=A0A094YYM8_ALKAL|nr:hypothetical protein [Alkalihalobacillus alcalophilus]KGA98647.1 hypothetical protein BALCAV_0203225 [Alkalihalobacillus alcalophilus ATCC 27647 = CGMCC 1.3604]MED1564278.1 hypothetical protein [Alkalihalobacillus alcalophilus]THG88683.1 hypothetical protein AJ85_01040 [Alkalihalobacillus alcalophilus ATCC 27647 = CGMCC 1.3604]
MSISVEDVLGKIHFGIGNLTESDYEVLRKDVKHTSECMLKKVELHGRYLEMNNIETEMYHKSCINEIIKLEELL